MQKRPLAYRVRPKTLDDVVGQDHLVGPDGVIRKMIEREQYFSLILYGKPGIGKTTIATVIGEAFGLNTFTFNASTDNKATLKEIIESAKRYGALLIVDEIHRMKKDIQDYLLPHVESGNVTLIGLTTNNPYHSVNPAVRSRTHVLKLKDIENDELFSFLKRLIKNHPDDLSANFDDDVIRYVVQTSNREIRTAINMLELLNIAYDDSNIDLAMAKKVLLKPALDLDKNEDNYYNILSALQKSIRGSDVDAALHYLARLIKMEDLDSILRRLTVIAYEDVGLANPSIFSKMDACARACERVGFPEARIPLADLTVEMALSPKSNSAYKALDKALEDIENGKMGKVPNHLINVANFEDKAAYLYPHDYDHHVVKQQYLPDQLAQTRYYEPAKTGKYERSLKERMDAINRILGK
ncbi:MAG: replication-associated recombination protein A [Bacillota bacterium]